MISKIIICGPTGTADYIHFRRYADVVAAAWRRQSIDAVSLAFSEPGFISTVANYAADANNVIYFTFYCFSDEVVPSARLPLEILDIVKKAKARILVRIDDHIFTTFQQSGVMLADPKMGFLIGEATFEYEAKTINPALKSAVFHNFGHLPLIDFDEGTHIAFEEREIDVLVPLSMGDRRHRNIRSLLSSVGPGPIARVADSTYQTLRADFSRNPLEIFVAYFEEFTGTTLDDIRAGKLDTFSSLMMILSVVDEMARQARRFEMLKRLLKSVGKLNVVVLYPDVPGLDVDKNTRFIGRKNGDEYAKMLANSRAVVNCNATYPNSIHGRITNGMSYGCAVITDTNPAISSYFSTNEFIPYTPELTLADAFSSNDVAAIAGAGMRRLKNDPDFSRDAHADHMKRLITRLPSQKAWWKIF